MHFAKIKPEDGQYTDWLLYQSGSYSRPVCILAPYEVRALATQYAALDPEWLRETAKELLAAPAGGKAEG